MSVEISRKRVKTRKKHRCYCCERVIPAKRDMDTRTIADEDAVYTLYICATCEEAMKRHDYTDCYGEYQEGCCVDGGGFWEPVRHELEDKEPDSIGSGGACVELTE